MTTITKFHAQYLLTHRTPRQRIFLFVLHQLFNTVLNDYAFDPVFCTNAFNQFFELNEKKAFKNVQKSISQTCPQKIKQMAKEYTICPELTQAFCDFTKALANKQTNTPASTFLSPTTNTPTQQSLSDQSANDDIPDTYDPEFFKEQTKKLDQYLSDLEKNPPRLHKGLKITRIIPGQDFD